jgi:hypothetical protein
MPKGRKLEGDTERQTRHSARQLTSQPRGVNKRPRADRRSRVQRWNNATTAAIQPPPEYGSDCPQ